MNQQFGTNQGSGDAQDYSQLVEQLYSRYVGSRRDDRA